MIAFQQSESHLKPQPLRHRYTHRFVVDETTKAIFKTVHLNVSPPERIARPDRHTIQRASRTQTIQ